MIKSELKELFSLGILFFIVQISGLIIFASSNVLITRILSPAEVTPYQISYKYFSLTIMVFTIITAPLWSATTDAYTKNDWKWINNMMNKMNKIMLAFLVLLILMLASSEFIYKIWIGGKVEIGYLLSALMAIYMCVLIYSTCYSNILFGIGKSTSDYNNNSVRSYNIHPVGYILRQQIWSLRHHQCTDIR